MTTAWQGVITAKLRSMYARLLASARMRDLAAKRSISELCAYLQSETRYSEVLTGLQPHAVHRGQLEDLIRRQRFEDYSALTHYLTAAQLSGFYGYFRTAAEIELILKMVSLLNAGTPEEFARTHQRYLDGYIDISADKLGAARNFEQLTDALAGTPYARLIADTGGDYRKCDIALFRWFYGGLETQIDREFSGAAHVGLRDIFQTLVDLRNVKNIYRVKAFFPDTSETELVDTLLPPWSSRSRRSTVMLVHTHSADDFLTTLKQTAFASLFSSQDFDFIEQREDAIMVRRCEKQIHYSQAASVTFAAYMTLAEIEASALITIAEGVYYGLPQDEIMSLLSTVGS